MDAAHLRFLEMVSPVVAGNKFQIPPPTLCPECRLQRRLAFRNPIHVAWRTCAVSGRKVLSAYSVESRAKVIENDIWWGDSWDPLEYGRQYDPSKSFFPQFQLLRDAVPYAARLLTKCENSDYCSNVNEVKDCYFVFNTYVGESSMYCDYIWWGTNCLDITRGVKAELCYDCLETPGCYNLQSSEFCADCRDSFFLSHCRSCSDCFGCVNLARQRYCVFNKQLTESEYRSFIAGLNLSSYRERQGYQAEWEKLKITKPRPHMYGRRIEECSGNYLENSTRVYDSHYIIGGEDLRYCFVLNGDVKNCYDFSHFGNKTENIYECASSGTEAFQLLFCRDCWMGNADLTYCSSCFGCKDCFGCVGLRKKQYCFFNVQYTKAEYEEQVSRCIASMIKFGEWGEFFPIETSPFPYNVSFAQRYFPLTEEQAVLRGLGWYHQDEVEAAGAIPASQLPDGLPPTDEPISVLSEQSGRPFRITTREIQRYREFKVPLPRVSYIERMEARWSRLGGIELFERESALSGKKLLTTLSPKLAPVIWDREEWEQEIWG